MIKLDIGKLPHGVLKNIIIEPIKSQGIINNEIVVSAEVGQDCAAIDFSDNLAVFSTDPITGAANNMGKLLVNVCANDVAASGGKPIAMMITALFPPDVTEDDIKYVLDEVRLEAKSKNIDIIGGHTEITDAVTRTVITGMVIGKATKNNITITANAQINDDIVFTKSVAIEASLILASEFKDKIIDTFGKDFYDRCLSLSDQLSVLNESSIAIEFGASSMHDVTEGGLLGACYECADGAKVGFSIDLRKVPIIDTTKKLCDFLGLNPYKSISSGSMLITVKDGYKLADELRRNGIEAAVIGKVIDAESCYIDIDGVNHIMVEPQSDEIYRVVGRNKA